MAKKISGSVGKGGKNYPADVRLVQELLNANLGKMRPMRSLQVTSRIDEKTISAIETFQRRVLGMMRPDGKIESISQTMRSMSLSEN